MPDNFLTSDALLASKQSATDWVAPNLLPVGVAILAGAPKIGKSWLALQIARAVAAGEPLFGEPVARGRVLYLALEDTPVRLQERLARQAWPEGVEAEFMLLPHLTVQFSGPRDERVIWLASHMPKRGYRLVVVDTLSHFLTGFQGGMTPISSSLLLLQLATQRMRCAVLLIDHHRKHTEEDVVADLAGSTMKGATADTTIGLYRQRGRGSARLSVTGRDVAERTLALKMDWETGCWQYLGEAEEVELGERKQEILEALKEMKRSTVAEISRAVRQDPSNTRKRVQQLLEAGLIRRERGGYVLTRKATRPT